MRTNLEKARHYLETGHHTCVLCKGDRVYTSGVRGVSPLLRWLDAGTELQGFSAADKVVGKATAMLYCLLGVREVYAGVMSRAAVKVLLRHGIGVLYTEQVDFIWNREHTGQCPMEAAVADIEDPAAGRIAVEKRRAELLAGK